MTEKQLVNAIQQLIDELSNSFGTRIIRATFDQLVAIINGKRVDIIFEWSSKNRCYIKIYAPKCIKIIRDYKGLISQFWLAFYG